MDNSILVLSSHSRPSTGGPVNHSVYCQINGYDYLFDATPYNIASPYDQKIYSIISALKRSNKEWLFWVDDDAYFMDMSVKLEDFLDVPQEADIIICRSPVNLEGKWSAINSGLFFIRNNISSVAMFERVLHTSMQDVKDWWSPDKHGIFIEGGDQERMLYVFENDDRMRQRVIILDHQAFNSRVYHFTDKFDQHFVCHLASHRDKSVPLKMMQERFKLDSFLLPRGYNVSPYRMSIFSSAPRLSVVKALRLLSRRLLRR